MRISDWSSDVCSSDLPAGLVLGLVLRDRSRGRNRAVRPARRRFHMGGTLYSARRSADGRVRDAVVRHARIIGFFMRHANHRSEEHTSELQSLMRISYAVFCLTKTNKEHQLQTI